MPRPSFKLSRLRRDHIDASSHTPIACHASRKLRALLIDSSILFRASRVGQRDGLPVANYFILGATGSYRFARSAMLTAFL